MIRSRQNARVKRLRQAFANKGPTDGGLVMIEGEHLVQEAIRSGLAMEAVFVREDAAAKSRSILRELPGGCEVNVLSPEVFDSAVETESPQGIAAFVQTPKHDLEKVLTRAERVIVLDGVQDPGNVGTIVRSAEAFGAGAVIGLAGTASFWNFKAVRASAGSIFRVPVFVMAEAEAHEALRKNKFQFVATIARGGEAPDDIAWSRKTALLIGSEGRGLSQQWMKRANAKITLPMRGTVESLNAAVAASLLLYEAAKR